MTRRNEASHLKALVAGTLALLLQTQIATQERLLSREEGYYDFLALQGRIQRPYLNYRTLSDSQWTGVESAPGPWSAVPRNRISLGGYVDMRLYWPEGRCFYNSDLPFGQNDGALWQGRGVNLDSTAGIRLVAFGLELTIKPQFVFSQNLFFRILPSAYDSPYGYYWGGARNVGADAPQRFGDAAIVGFSWGDSELRFSWKGLTVGIGTQSPWIGPGRINAIIHSNNAAPYPKIDAGIRKTRIRVGDVDLGELEARLWLGNLKESAYFDSDPSNDDRLVSGLAVGYAPSILPGLALFATRTYLSKWRVESLATIPTLLFFKFNNNGGDDSWDQRVSLGFDFLLPEAGVEFYGEAGLNDNPGPTLDAIIRNFSHDVVYTGGFRKAVALPGKDLEGELLFEWSNLESSAVYAQFIGTSSFYFHGQIVQGYTNEGQWLGAGIGTGGNSQYLGFKIFHKSGSLNFYAWRYNPDNDFLLRFTTPSAGYPADNIYDTNFKAVLALGLQTTWFFPHRLALDAGIALVQVHDPLYSGGWFESEKTNGFRLEFGLSRSL